MSGPAEPVPAPAAGQAGTPGRVEVLADADELAEAAASAAARDLADAVAAGGEATWVLAGGGTPLAAYRLLAGEPLRGAVPWQRLRVVMGDERAVPRDHPESNWGRTAEALLDAVPIPDAGRLRPRGELPVEQAAADYERQLRALPATVDGWPRLDLVWLGVGEDGHTLSLFPGRPEVAVADRVVVAVRGAPKPPPERIGLSLAALRGAGRCVVVASGAGKADPVARALAGDDALPLTLAVRTATAAGASVTWLLDEAAASALG